MAEDNKELDALWEQMKNGPGNQGGQAAVNQDADGQDHGEAGDQGGGGQDDGGQIEGHQGDQGQGGGGQDDGEQGQPGQINWEEITGGRVKSQEELSGVFSQYDTTLKKLQDIETENRAYQEALGESLFASDSVKGYNQWVKATGIENPQLYSKISGINTEDISDQDALVIATLIDTPELIGQENALKVKMSKQYGFDKERWEEEDSNYEPKYDDIDRVRDVQRAKKTIKETLGKLQDGGTEDPISQHKSRFESAKQIWSAVPEKTKGMSRKVNLGTAEQPINYEIPSETFQSAVKSISDRNMKLGVGLKSEEDVQRFMQEATSLAIAQSLPSVLERYKEAMRPIIEKELDAKYHNAGGVESQRGAGGGGAKNAEDELWEQLQKKKA